MKQYLLKISYDGKNYFGWAKQKDNIPTIQGEIEKVIRKIFKNERIGVFASGRTDRFVHALSLPVFLKGEYEINKDELFTKLNNELPNDIRINEIDEVSDDFHVRFDAKGKKYRYLINLNDNGDENYCLNYSYNFDFLKFERMSKKLIGKKNFASFTGKEVYDDYVRIINSIELNFVNNQLTFEIIGEGFMRYMVRNIVGVLLAHNRGKISDEDFIDLLNNPVKGKSHYKAPGSGLYLVEVYY